METVLRQLLAYRLHSQGFTSEQRGVSVSEVVKRNLGMQAQDEELALYSFHLRNGQDLAQIQAELASGDILRTHILRPTWHYVHREDIRWLLALTGYKVITATRAWQNKLGISDELQVACEKALIDALSEQSLTRAELSATLPIAKDLPSRTAKVRCVLQIAEAKGIICSNSQLLGNQHTYMLLDHCSEPLKYFQRSEAIEQLVYRFLQGHGTASVRDLQRWVNLTKLEVERALKNVADEVLVYDGQEHYYLNQGKVGWDSTWSALLPTFDEVLLSHRGASFPILNPRDYQPRFDVGGGGSVIVNCQEIGTFKRKKLSNGKVEVELQIDDTYRNSGKLETLSANLQKFYQG